jgi:hypothetical protein
MKMDYRKTARVKEKGILAVSNRGVHGLAHNTLPYYEDRRQKIFDLKNKKRKKVRIKVKESTINKCSTSDVAQIDKKEHLTAEYNEATQHTMH